MLRSWQAYKSLWMRIHLNRSPHSRCRRVHKSYISGHSDSSEIESRTRIYLVNSAIVRDEPSGMIVTKYYEAGLIKLKEFDTVFLTYDFAELCVTTPNE